MKPGSLRFIRDTSAGKNATASRRPGIASKTRRALSPWVSGRQ